MDPLTILGAYAAASQIVEQGINIVKFLSDVYSKAQDASESIRKQIVHVEQLTSLARLIIQNPSLQRDSIASVLRTCLSVTRQFQALLERLTINEEEDGRFRRAKKAVSAVLREKEIDRFFADLEKQKTLLLLCIEEVDSKLLGSIDLRLDAVIATTEKVSMAVDGLPEMSRNVIDMHQMLPEVARNVQVLMQFNSLKRRPTLKDAGPVLQPEASVKSYYIVPSRRVRGFVGREDTLSRIGAAFSADEGSTPRIVVVRAMGGQGKTQVALEYCHRSKGQTFQAIFWADATSEETMKKSFEAIAERIKMPGHMIHDDERVQFVRDSLGEWPEPWLMVFDNYDDPVSFNSLDTFIPDAEHGCILITTRHSDADALADCTIELPGLGPAAALELLFKQSQIKDAEKHREEGQLIVDRLGYHPLAITQAGSYIKLRKIGLEQFTEHYQVRREAILKETPKMTQYRRKLNDANSETALNVFTTWELSFQQLLVEENKGDLMSDILTLFAFFNCKDVSEQIFKTFSSSPEMPRKQSIGPGKGLYLLLNRQELWDEHKFTEILIELTQTSLLQTWSKESDGFCHFSLHPLIQDWILLRTDLKSFKQYFAIAASIISRTLAISEKDQDFDLPLAIKQAVLSHVEVHLENKKFLEKEGQTSLMDEFSNLHESELWIARLLDRIGREGIAYGLISETLGWRERVLGPDDKLTIDILYDWSGMLSELEKYQQAVDIDRRLVESCVRIFGKDSVEAFKSYNCLYTNLSSMDAYEEANNIYEQHLKRFEDSFGPTEPETGCCVHNRALVLERQGKYAEAEILYLRVRDLDASVYAPGHIQRLISLDALARVLLRQDKYAESEAIHQEISEQKNTAFGFEHPGTLFNRHEIAWVLYLQKKYSEAETVMRDVIEHRTRVLGADHDDTLLTQRILAKLKIDQGNYAEAEEICNTIVAIKNKKFGPESPESEINLEDLAAALAGENKKSEVVAVRKSLLAIVLKVYGPEQTNICMAHYWLAVAFSAQEKHAEAEQHYQICYDKEIQLYGLPENVTTSQTLQRVAEMQMKQEKHAEAESNFHRVIDSQTETRLLETTYNIFDWLGLCLNSQKKYTEAEEAYRKCYNARTRYLGPEDTSTLEMLKRICDALRDQGKYAESESIARNLVEIRSRHMSERQLQGFNVVADPGFSTEVSLAHYKLGVVLQGLEKYQEAEMSYRKCYDIEVVVLGRENDSIAKTLQALGYVLYRQNQYTESEGFMKQALSIREKVLNKDHADTRYTLSWLGQVQRDLENFQDAELTYERLCDLGESSVGLGDTDTLNALWWYQWVLSKANKLCEKENVWRRIAKGRAIAFGNENSETLSALSSVAESLHDQGKNSAAETIYQQVCTIRERTVGLVHIDTVDSLQKLGEIYRAEKKYAEEEALHRRLVDRATTLGPDHADLIPALTKLAETLKVQEKCTESSDIYWQILKLQEKVVGQDIHKIHHTLTWLEDSLSNTERHEERAEVLKRIIINQDQIHGPEYANTLTRLWWLQYSLGKLNRLAEQENVWYRILQAREKSAGPESADTLEALSSLSVNLRDQGKHSDSATIYERLWKSREKVLGPEHSDTLSSLWWTGYEQLQGKDYSTSVATYRKLIPLKEKALGDEHTDTITCIGQYAQALRVLPDWSEAVVVYRRLYNVRAKLLGLEHEDVRSSLWWLAHSLKNEGSFPEAKTKFFDLCEVQEKVLGLEDADTISCLTQFGEMARGQSDWPLTIEVHEKLHKIQRVKLGTEHADTQLTLSWLSWALWKDKKLDQAVEKYTQLCQIQERVYGINHADTLSYLSKLGQVLREQPNWPETVILYRRLYEIQRNSSDHGFAHSETRSSLWWLSWALRQAQMVPEAIESYKTLCDLQEKVLGRKHEDFLSCLVQFGQFVREIPNWMEAARVYKQLYEVRKESPSFGSEHSETRLSFHWYCVALKEIKDPQAEEYYKFLCQLQDKVLGAEAEDTITCLTQFGQLLYERANWQEATVIYTRLRTFKEKACGLDDANFRFFLWRQSWSLWMLKEYEKAEDGYRLLCPLEEKALGAENLRVISCLNQYGDLLWQRNKWSDSKAIYQRVLDLRRSVKVSKDRSDLIILARLGQCNLQLEQPTEAIKIYTLQVTVSEDFCGLEGVDTLYAVQNLAFALGQCSRFDEAKQQFERTLSGFCKLFGDDSPQVKDSMLRLDRLLQKQKLEETAKAAPDSGITVQAETQHIVDDYSREIDIRGLVVGKRCRLNDDSNTVGEIVSIGAVPELKVPGTFVGIKFDKPVASSKGTIHQKEDNDNAFGGFVRPTDVELGELGVFKVEEKSSKTTTMVKQDVSIASNGVILAVRPKATEPAGA